MNSKFKISTSTVNFPFLWTTCLLQWQPLQYSCLENPMDGGAWGATVHGVAESRTRLSDFTHSLIHSHIVYYAVLIWGPPWFFIKSNVYTIINTFSFLTTHHLSLLVNIRCFAMLQGLFCLVKFICIHF